MLAVAAAEIKPRELARGSGCYNPHRFAMVVARRYVISGRVQGVGFRFFAQDAARQEAIAGFVRNLPTRDVEVVAEGDREAMERFERALRRGPAQARVDQVRVEELLPTSRYAGFGIE